MERSLIQEAKRITKEEQHRNLSAFFRALLLEHKRKHERTAKGQETSNH